MKKRFLFFMCFLIFLPLGTVSAFESHILTIQNDENLGVDTRIANSTATTNYGLDGSLRIGEQNNFTDTISRSLFYFDISSIPSDAILTDVVFSLIVEADFSSTSRTGYCARLSAPFLEHLSTWNSTGYGFNWTSAGSDYNETLMSYAFPASLSVGSQVDFTTNDLTEWQNLIDGTNDYFGFTCLMATELNDAYSFYSSADVNPSNHPKLVFHYDIPSAFDYEKTFFYFFVIAILVSLFRDPIYFFIFVILYYVLENQSLFDLDVFFLAYFMFYLVGKLISEMKGLFNDLHNQIT